MPEFNLIQRPDLLTRVAQFFGLKQAHIVPTLSENVQLVAILADMRDEKPSQQDRPPVEVTNQAIFGAAGAAAVNVFKVRNPAASPVRIQMLSMRVASSVDWSSCVQRESAAFNTVLVNGVANAESWGILPNNQPLTYGVFEYKTPTAGVIATPFTWANFASADAATPMDWDLSNIHLLPGFEFLLSQQIFNGTLHVQQIRWREVPLRQT